MDKIKNQTAKNLYKLLKAKEPSLPEDEFEALTYLENEEKLETIEQILTYLENYYINDIEKKELDKSSYILCVNRGAELASNAINPSTDAYFHFLKLATDSFSNAIAIDPNLDTAFINRGGVKIKLAKAWMHNQQIGQSELADKIEAFLFSESTSSEEDIEKAADLGNQQAKNHIKNNM